MDAFSIKKKKKKRRMVRALQVDCYHLIFFNKDVHVQILLPIIKKKKNGNYPLIS